MRVLIDVLHPAHVHFFRHFASRVLEEGGDVVFTARRKDVTIDLLEEYGLPFETLSSIHGGALGLGRELLVRTLATARLARRFQPDIMVGFMGPVIAPLGRLMGIPSAVFYDTETAWMTNFYAFPLCNHLFVPESYLGWTPRKAVRFVGCKQLAYLHPSHFEPDPGVRAMAGLSEKEPFAVVRLVSWEASHDVGDTGFCDPVGFVRKLAERIRVVVSAEREVPAQIKPFALRLQPTRMHHLLAEASLYIGEGATMAAEAAVLGTPAVFVHTARLGYIVELEERFGLLRSVRTQAEAVEAVDLLLKELPSTTEEFRRRRAKLIDEAVDLSQWMFEQVRRRVPMSGHGETQVSDAL